MATVILGMQWGDEGKGKITHLLAREAAVVVRFSGGPNAGHTVIDRGVKFGTHQLPAGAFYPGVRCVLASGMVIDLTVLREEYETIAAHLNGKIELIISENAHLILPYHRTLEELEGSGASIGTTRRGIGPAYRDKAARVGIRAGDLLDPDRLREKLTRRLALLQRLWPASEEIASFSAAGLADGLFDAGRPFLTSIGDAAGVIRAALRRAPAGGEEVLFEGAQGALLDLDFGTYPYVTSSTTTFAGLGQAIGIPNPRVERRLGVVKAYTTRVGQGSFPTEITGGIGARLQEKGGEVGVTTGRPRRCGWLDLVALKHAARLNGPTGLAVTKLDVLSGLPEIKICVAYRLRGERTERFPLADEDLAHCQPIYETLSGWEEGLEAARRQSDLPRAAREYLERIAAELDSPISLISVGPAPEETIVVG